MVSEWQQQAFEPRSVLTQVLAFNLRATFLSAPGSPSMCRRQTSLGSYL